MLSTFRRSLTQVIRAPLSLSARINTVSHKSLIHTPVCRSFSQKVDGEDVNVAQKVDEMDDLETFADFSASGHPITMTDYWSELAGQIAEGIDEGDFPMDNGEIVFDQRSSANPTYKIRVLRHAHTFQPATDEAEMLSPEELDAQKRKDMVLTKLREAKPSAVPAAAVEKVRYEFQTVYDGGDDYCDAPIITTKAIIQTSPASSDVLLPSSCAMMSAATLLNHAPRRALLCSSWGGSIAKYLTDTIGCAVHIVDTDVISRDAARETVAFQPAQVSDVPAHPLAVAALDGTPEEVVAAMDAAVQYGSMTLAPSEPAVTVADRFTSADAYLRALFPQCDHKHIDAAQRILADRAAADKARASHAKLVAAAAADPALPAVPAFEWKSPSAKEPLARYHSALLEMATDPVRAYDMIIQDTEASPALSTEAWLRLCQRVLAVSSKDHSSLHGVWVRRMTLPPADASGAGPFAEMDFESVNDVCALARRVFKHVYIGQPSEDSVVIMATDNANLADSAAHPASEERLIDVAVAMWERKVMSLEVMERVACFVPYTGGDVGKLLGWETQEK